MGLDNTAGHNAKARATTIRKIIREMENIEVELEPLTERMKDLKKRVKEDLEIKPAHFVVMRKLYAMERDERDTLSDVIREGFEALGIGEQSDFIPALVQTEEAETEERPWPDDEHEDPDNRIDDDSDETIEVVPL